jgi:hypothetical protein
VRRAGLAVLIVAAAPSWAAAQAATPAPPGREPSAQGAAETPPSEPILTVEFSETEAIPGQPLVLRLAVLVPTFMPSPPVWPSFEAPNLLVRLPEGSTSPVSRRVGGDTWSGVSRRYSISPMMPGSFAIPPQSVVVTYVDPDTTEPARATLSTGPIVFAGVLPDGAEGLDPFLAARAVDLAQEVVGNPSTMVPGDSFTRTVTARISGTSPMFLPDLLPTHGIEGLAAYSDAPVIEESFDRGVLSGTRTESVTYVAEGGGSGAVPALALDWYDLDAGGVETATVDGFAVRVDGPPVRSAAQPDWRGIARAALLSLAAVAVLVPLVRRAVPRVRRGLERWHATRAATERHAFAAVRRAAAARDMSRLYPALEDWARKAGDPDPRRDAALSRALNDLGASRYGPARGGEAQAWRALADALPGARRSRRARGRADGLRANLPPLNPGA